MKSNYSANMVIKTNTSNSIEKSNRDFLAGRANHKFVATQTRKNTKNNRSSGRGR